MTTVLKLGGELLEDVDAVRVAARGIARLAAEGPLAVVHGGGRAITANLRARGVQPHVVDGIRVTTDDILESVVCILAGQINTALVAALSTEKVKGVGLTGADAALGLVTRAPAFVSSSGALVDLGLVGVPEPDAPATLVTDLLALGYMPVIASLGVTAAGALLNVNADVLASHLSRAIQADRLIVAGATPGVFDAAGVPCPALSAQQAQTMIDAGTARDGMVAKLRAVLDARMRGVTEVRVVDGRDGAYATAAGTRIAPSAINDQRSGVRDAEVAR